MGESVSTLGLFAHSCQQPEERSTQIPYRYFKINNVSDSTVNHPPPPKIYSCWSRSGLCLRDSCTERGHASCHNQRDEGSVGRRLRTGSLRWTSRWHPEWPAWTALGCRVRPLSPDSSLGKWPVGRSHLLGHVSLAEGCKPTVTSCLGMFGSSTERGTLLTVTFQRLTLICISHLGRQASGSQDGGPAGRAADLRAQARGRGHSPWGRGHSPWGRGRPCTGLLLPGKTLGPGQP